MSRLLRLFALLLFTSLIALTHAAPAADNNLFSQVTVSDRQVGFANHYKLGCWTPVTVTLSGNGDSLAAARLDAEATDGDGVPVWFTGPRLTAAGQQTATVYTRIGRPNQPIRTRLTPANGDSALGSELLSASATTTLPQALPATSDLIIELGASIGLSETFQRLNQSESERTTVVTIDKQPHLPEQWYGYDGVDVVVIAGTSAAEKSWFSLPALDALEAWVRQGGKLLVCCGDGAEKVLGKDAPLARFAPGELVGVINLPAARFGPLENFAAAEQRLDATAIRVSQWKNLHPEAHIELSGSSRAEDLPLVIRWPLGFGEIEFVALDLHCPPFTDWPSRGKFLERLLTQHSQTATQTANSHGANQRKQLGYVDLSGQLRGALDQFSGVQLIPFWAVAILALAYITLLFPLNYWLVSRAVRRQSLAWIVFPTTVIIFCLAAYALANYAKGNGRHVNQVDLIDVDLPAASVRGTSWFNVFSPDNALYDLTVQPPANNTNGSTVSSTSGTAPLGSSTTPSASGAPADSNSPVLFGWFGLAGTGLGGMSSPAVNPPLFDEPYTIDPARGTASGVPLATWSSKSFVARWNGDGSGFDATLTATPDHRLNGTVTNQLQTPLNNCVLLFNRWVYSLDTLAPGKPVALDRREPQTFDTYLTKRRTIAAHDEVPTYDRAGIDIPRIIEVMMFHEAAGGANYTGLLHRYQRFVDLTSQLEFGRAIVVGQSADGARVVIDGQPVDNYSANSHTTIRRFVLPVKLHD